VVTGGVELVAVEHEFAVDVGHALEFGAAIGFGNRLFPDQQSVLVAQGDDAAVVIADVGQSAGADRGSVATHAERRQAAVEYPLAGSVGWIQAEYSGRRCYGTITRLSAMRGALTTSDVTLASQRFSPVSDEKATYFASCVRQRPRGHCRRRAAGQARFGRFSLCQNLIPAAGTFDRSRRSRPRSACRWLHPAPALRRVVDRVDAISVHHRMLAQPQVLLAAAQVDRTTSWKRKSARRCPPAQSARCPVDLPPNQPFTVEQPGATVARMATKRSSTQH
jgi:hypothetical protein